MEVLEYQEGDCHCMVWRTTAAGWLELSVRVDALLATAIARITEELTADDAQWLEINYWPDAGRLVVFPSAREHRGQPAERFCFELSSKFLASEFVRVVENAPADCKQPEWQQTERLVWITVSSALRENQAAAKLREARKTHPLRIVGYSFDLKENLVRLEEDGRLRLM
jgi:hypothetical protein